MEGHISDLIVAQGYNTLLLKFYCLPEMRKDRIKKSIFMRLEFPLFKMKFASCRCVARKRSKTSCKSIASVQAKE